MLKILSLTLVIVMVSACVGTEKSDVTAGGSASASAPAFWQKSKFPLKIKITDAFTTQSEVDAITDGAEQWEDSTQDKINFFEFQTERPHEITNGNFSMEAIGKDTEMVVYKTTNWPFDMTTLAITQYLAYRYNIGTSSEYVDIIHADIMLNYEYCTFVTSGTSGYDLKTVLLHEFGHFLGLQHIADLPRSNKAISVMYPSISFGEQGRKVPFQYDINKLQDLYGIVQGQSGAAASAASKLAEEKYTPFDDGKEVVFQFELKKDGECVHKENGVIVHRHHSPHIKEI